VSFNFRESLEDDLNTLSLKATPQQIDKLDQYFHLLIKWNKRSNLVGTQDHSEIYIRHFLDSLALVSYLSEVSWTDLGSGAGFPGLILAIMRPESDIFLVEIAQKRCHFLQQVIIELALSRVVLYRKRVEDLTVDDVSRHLICRAFVPYERLDTCVHLMKPDSVFCYPQGKFSQEIDCGRIPSSLFLDSVQVITVPNLKEARHILFLKKQIN
jgi:16S rRNA (guanine527-N7)-methyltransferase